jgi:cyclopropane fatty-acyl-phospholipid synthase-like methyltransferase
MKIGNHEFDDAFVHENMMGPNSIRIIEEMTRTMELEEGMRVLDLGCGKGLTSIFLAKEFGVTVYATDLWIPASENFQRFKSLGLEDRIIPIHADAHDLPFADEYFDAIMCVDAFQYFGHEEGYLEKHLIGLLKRGGQIAVGIPGLQEEFENGIPREMQPFIKQEYNFHSCAWWKDLWERSNAVDITMCGELDCHKQSWDEWLAWDNEHAIRDIDMMKVEGGRYFNLVSMIAERK